MLRTRPLTSRRPHTAARTLGIAVVALAVTTSAAAQDSRQELLEAAQARKAQELHPYEPDRLDRTLTTVDSVLRLMSTGAVYPFVGSSFEGGGLTVGPGYRGVFGDTGRFDVHAGWSFKNYRTADATLALPTFMKGRVSLALRANWIEAPDVAFYGEGNTSDRDNRTGFGYESTTIGATLRFKATRHVAFGAGLDSLDITTSSLADSTPVPAVNPKYRRARVFAEVDTRTSPGYTRRGGLYRAEWSTYDGTNGTASSFRRFDAEVRHFIPLMRENWVIALRGLASSTDASAGHDVPFFLMPELGGGNWLRGYPSWRFRDRNRLLFSGEYRWTAGQFVDMALFLDAGKVASKFGDLGSESFKKTYGIGMSVHTLASTVARIELARTGEGTSVLLSFGPSF